MDWSDNDDNYDFDDDITSHNTTDFDPSPNGPDQEVTRKLDLNHLNDVFDEATTSVSQEESYEQLCKQHVVRPSTCVFLSYDSAYIS